MIMGSLKELNALWEKVSKPNKVSLSPESAGKRPSYPQSPAEWIDIGTLDRNGRASYHYAALHQGAVPITARSSRLRRLCAGFG
jgi:hypothetical protein